MSDKEILNRVSKLIDIKDYKFLDSTKNPEGHGCPICTGESFPRKKEIFYNPKFICKISDKMLAFFIAHEQEHIENREFGQDEFAATLGAINRLKLPLEESEKIAVDWYVTYWYDKPIVSDKKYTDKFLELLEKYKDEFKL